MQPAINNKQKELLFPELPSYKANWVAIYWEPIVLSGERICSVIAALGHNGDILVQPVLRLNVLKTLYPKNHSEALSILQWVAQDLTDHLESAGDFSTWVPPMSGFSLGDEISSLSDNIEGILIQAIPMCSSLSNSEIFLDASLGKAAEMSQDRWKATIKDGVITRLPRLKQSFDRQFCVVKGARQTQIDFVGRKLASNFSRLVSSQLSRSVKDSKSQILDLVALRDRMDLFPGDEQYQLLVWRPNKNQDFGLSETQLNNIEEAFLELEGEGDRFELRVKSYHEPANAAEDICRIEVAM